MKKKLIIDLDNTITIHNPDRSYQEMSPNPKVIETMRYYRSIGYNITIFTARNMRTYEGDIVQIYEKTVPIIMDWLNGHDVPFDELIVGKPWCADGFYVDDKAIRPNEFVSLTEKQILDLING